MDTPTVPDALALDFDVEALNRDAGAVVALDAAGTIVWVNDAWHRFAHKNGAPDVAARFGRGARYLDGVRGPLADYFARAFDEVRARREPWALEYECSSAEEFRMHRLRVLPLRDGGLLLEHCELACGPHDRAAERPVEALYRDLAGVIAQCANCRRVRRVENGWHWIPAWVHAPPPAPVSHGLCTTCAGHYLYATRTRRQEAR
ncbi:MAG: hypothetical protein U0325_21340 [Polyangiales bacterium]